MSKFTPITRMVSVGRVEKVLLVVLIDPPQGTG